MFDSDNLARVFINGLVNGAKTPTCEQRKETIPLAHHVQGVQGSEFRLTSQFLHHLVTVRHIVRHGCANDRTQLTTPVEQGWDRYDGAHPGEAKTGELWGQQ